MTNTPICEKMTTAALDVGLVPHDLDAMLAFYKGGLAMSLLDDLEVGKTQLMRFSAGQGFCLQTRAEGRVIHVYG